MQERITLMPLHSNALFCPTPQALADGRAAPAPHPMPDLTGTRHAALHVLALPWPASRGVWAELHIWN